MLILFFDGAKIHLFFVNATLKCDFNIFILQIPENQGEKNTKKHVNK